MTAVCGRLLRTVVRQPAILIRNVVAAGFVLVVASTALKTVEQSAIGLKSASVIFPMAVLLAVSGVSQAGLVAEDIQHGFFDRLVLSSSRRLPVMVGYMLADLALGAIASIPLLIVGLILGVKFHSGAGGFAVVVVLAAAWAAAYGGLWYAVAFRTADPAKARWGYSVFLPLVLFAPALAPRDAMSGWVAKAFAFNPVTYLIDGIRSLETDGWSGSALAKAAAVIVGVGFVALMLAWGGFRARLRHTMGGEEEKKPPKPAAPTAEAEKSETQLLREALEAERQARIRAEERLAGGGG
jgi:ABC-2 type transport system permease protein